MAAIFRLEQQRRLEVDFRVKRFLNLDYWSCLQQLVLRNFLVFVIRQLVHSWQPLVIGSQQLQLQYQKRGLCLALCYFDVILTNY